MEIVQVVDPFDTQLVETFLLATSGLVAFIVITLLMMMRRIRLTIESAQRQAMKEQSAIDQAMRAIWEAQPLYVRAHADVEQGMYLMGRAVLDSYSTAQEFADALARIFSSKIGPRDHATRRIIEEMEADAPLPPVFWAVEGVGGRWMVLHETEEGREAFTFPNWSTERHRYARELEARYVAARLNLHPESVAAGRDMLGYQAYRPELVALFGETYADESI